MNSRHIFSALIALTCLAISESADAMYHTRFGRFIQRDPLGYSDGLNTYAGYHILHGGVDPIGNDVAWNPGGVGFPGPVQGPLYPNGDTGTARAFFSVARWFMINTDSKGRELFWHWIWGDGEDFNRIHDQEWGRYIMEDDPHNGMSKYLKKYFAQQSTSHSDIALEKYFDYDDSKLPMHIGSDKGGYKSGIELLHGVNLRRHGLQINGRGKRAMAMNLPSKYTSELPNVNKTDCVFMYRAMITFNDIFDPVGKYDFSRGKIVIGNEKALADLAHDYGGTVDYNIKISWSMRLITTDKPEVSESSADVAWYVE